MSDTKVFCGYYCTFLAVIGVYFWACVCIMALNENNYLKIFLMGQKEDYNKDTKDLVAPILITIGVSLQSQFIVPKPVGFKQAEMRFERS